MSIVKQPTLSWCLSTPNSLSHGLAAALVVSCFMYTYIPFRREIYGRFITILLLPLTQGLAQPPATSTHSAIQLPCLPSTSGMSVSQRHLHPTPFSFSSSHDSQYSSSSLRFRSSSVVFSRYGSRGICLAGAFAGQCWIVVCRYPKSRK
jgi:hypothetical protein